MIVFNLTDVPPPGKPKNGPQDLRVLGKVIKPGASEEFSDDASLSKVSGWIWGGKISVDTVPSWYKAAKKSAVKAPKVVPDAKPELVGDKAEEKAVRVEVGIMEATVTPGPDGEFGTEDDKVEVKPKKKGGAKKKGKKK